MNFDLYLNIMKGGRCFKKFSLQWSVEGPLEGFLDLSDDLMKNQIMLNKFITGSIAISLSFIIFFLISLSVQSFQFYINFTDMLTLSIMIYTFKIFGTVILIALAIFILIVVFQSLRFFDVLYSRFEGLSDLWKGSKDIKDLDEKSGSETAGIDPYRSSLSITDDVYREIPQLSRQIGFASKLFFLASVFVFIDFILHITLITEEYGFLLPKYGQFEFLWRSGEIIFVLLFVLASLFTADVKDFLEYFKEQSKIVETVKSDETSFIPEGEDILERFKKYLKKRDHRLSKTIKDSCGNIDEDKKLKGSSGNEYKFDLSFISGKELEYTLLVKEVDSNKIDVDYCRDFVNQINDIIDNLEKGYGKRPNYLRAVILTTEKEDKLIDLEEEVVEFITRRTIRLSKGPGGDSMQTSIQIVIEEGETYSVFPFLPEGKIERR